MSRFKLYGLVMAFGVACILVLGAIPALDARLQQLRLETAASAPLRPSVLSDDNIPDAIAGLHLRHRIAKVSWDHSMLTLDLKIREERSAATALWEDMVALIRFSFGTTGNVQQLLVSVYRETGGRNVLLFYGDPRRSEWTKETLAALETPAGGEETSFRRKISLSSTPSGERWLRNLANS